MKEDKYAGGRCHLWKKCHYDTISLICIDKRLESIGQKGTLQYWWKSYEGGYIKNDLQLLGSDSDVLKMARVGSESTEILLYVKRVSLLQVQRLIKQMEEMENPHGCVIEELDDDGNVVGEAVSEEPMMMGNMVHDEEDDEDGEDDDFLFGVGLGYYFPSDVDMPDNEGNEAEEEQGNEAEEEHMTDFSNENPFRDDEEPNDEQPQGEDGQPNEQPQGEDGQQNDEQQNDGQPNDGQQNDEQQNDGQPNDGHVNEEQPHEEFIDPDYDLEDDDDDLADGMEAARSGVPPVNASQDNSGIGCSRDDHTMDFELNDNSSEYEDSDALNTESKTDDDVQTSTKARRRRYPAYIGMADLQDPQFCIGLRFANAPQLRTAIQNHSIYNRFQIRYKKNNTKKVEAICKGISNSYAFNFIF
ncbi:hypothetical protein M5689_002801 [Euphorbia peplus]|nr:hypothetical protein M5689_002801 [Euphorbia peplus]